MKPGDCYFTMIEDAWCVRRVRSIHGILCCFDFILFHKHFAEVDFGNTRLKYPVEEIEGGTPVSKELFGQLIGLYTDCLEELKETAAKGASDEDFEFGPGVSVLGPDIICTLRKRLKSGDWKQSICFFDENMIHMPTKKCITSNIESRNDVKLMPQETIDKIVDIYKGYYQQAKTIMAPCKKIAKKK